MLRKYIAAALACSAMACATGLSAQKNVLDEPASMRIVVLYFVSSDCIYSDRYFPEMERLQQKFAASGVRFHWVYPNQGEQLAQVRAHQKQFGAAPESALLDSDGAITRIAHTHITPEAAVLIRDNSGEWQTAYHGRIDDRYIRLGLERPHALHHDLQDAIQATLAGKPAAPAGGSAVGCVIMGPLH